MKVLLVLGCLAIGTWLVAASHEDQAETGLEAKNEGLQERFVNVREPPSAGGNNRKKPKSIKKPLTGALSPLRVKTVEKRNIKESPRQEGKRRRCPGCWSPLSTLTIEKELNIETSMQAMRQQRDTEEHEKSKKKPKHLKGKKKVKRIRNKNPRDKHEHFQEEDPESNDKRHKHRREKKDRLKHHGRFSPLSMLPPDTKTMHKVNSDMQDMTA